MGHAPGFRVPDFKPLHGTDVQVEVGPEEDEEGAVGVGVEEAGREGGGESMLAGKHSIKGVMQRGTPKRNPQQPAAHNFTFLLTPPCPIFSLTYLAATATAKAVLPTRLFHSKFSSNLASLKP